MLFNHKILNVNKIFFLMPILFSLGICGSFFLIPKYCSVGYSVVIPRACAVTMISIFLFSISSIAEKNKYRCGITIISCVVFLIYTLLQILEFYNIIAVGESFSMNFWATATDIDLILEFAPGQFKEIMICVVIFLVVTFLFSFCCISLGYVNKNRKLRLLGSAIALSCLIITFCIAENPVVNFCRMLNAVCFPDQVNENIDVENFQKNGFNFCTTTKDNLQIYSKGNGKNLVLIILESLEANFLDEELFPGLTPNLNRLKKLSTTLFFDNVFNASYTSAAVFQIMYGMPPSPLLAPSGGVAEVNSSLLKNFVSLPHLLKKAGYNFYHIEQSSSLSHVLKLDDVAVIYDSKKKRDHHTFQKALELFSSHVRTKSNPLALSVVTIDSHFPNGYIDQNTLRYPHKNKLPSGFSKHQLLDAIYNTDHHLGIFVNKILSSPEGKDTTIVIANDHLFMGNVDGVLSKKSRKNILFIVNSERKKTSADAVSGQADIPATIVDLLEIKSNYAFPCGQSLLISGGAVRKPSHFPVDMKLLNELIVAKRNATSAHRSTLSDAKEQVCVKCVENTFFLDCFGQEIRLENNATLFHATLEEKSVVGGGYPQKHGMSFDIQKKMIARAFSDKKSHVFLIGGVSEVKDYLYECIKLPKSLVNGWLVVYKHENGNIKAKLSENLERLHLDVSNIVDKDLKGLIEYDVEYQNQRVLQGYDFNASITSTQKGEFILSGNSTSVGKGIYTVDASSNINYSAKVQNISNSPLELHHGFILYDDRNRRLDGRNYPASKNTSCAKVICVEDGGKKIVVSGTPTGWYTNKRIARNAKDDHSDIPNYDVTSEYIVDIKQRLDGNTELVFNKPLTVDIAPGMSVRAHGLGGGWFYSGAFRLPPGESKQIKSNFAVKVNPLNFFYGNYQGLPRGGEKVQLVLVVLSKEGKKAALKVKDFRFMK